MLLREGRGWGDEATHLRRKLSVVADAGTLLEDVRAVETERDDVERRLSDVRRAARDERLEAWRARLRGSTTAVHAWCRGSQIPPDARIFQPGAEEHVSSSTPEALNMIARKWRKVWGRNLPGKGLGGEDRSLGRGVGEGGVASAPCF